VTKKQFIRLYQRFFPDGGKTKKNANKIFDSFDQDKNGKLLNLHGLYFQLIAFVNQ